MHFRRATLVTLFGLLVSLNPRVALAQVDQQPQATFKSGVDLVSVTAVVRDKKGRVVRTLTANDIVVTDAGKPRNIVGMQADDQAPASIALLVEVAIAWPVATLGGAHSYAPASQPAPWGRLTPRWSLPAHSAPADGTAYEAVLTPPHSGVLGCTARVLPRHELLGPAGLGLVRDAAPRQAR